MTTRTTFFYAALLVTLACDGRSGPGADREPAAGDSAAAAAMADRPGMEGMAGMAGMDASADGSVRLTAQQIRQFGVTFGTAEERTLTSTIRASGAVTADETRIVEVAPRVSGFVERLHVNFTGQAVQRGEPLLELYAPELVAAQEELLVARRLDRTLGAGAVPGMPEAPSDLLAAARRRLSLWDISDDQVDEVLRSGQVRRTLTLRSPASGVITEKRVVEGQSVPAGASLYTIVDLREVWVDVELRESDAAAVRVGSTARIELPALPGRTLTGRVTFIQPVLEPTTRTVRARVTVVNANLVLKPGMYATVQLDSPASRALTIPATALIRTGTRQVVFVEMGAGELMPHEVETGRTTAEFVEVLGGVSAGQRVVTSAQFLLESEGNIAEVMKAMLGQMGAADTKGMRDMPGMKMP